MEKKSYLMEHVAGRILKAVANAFPGVTGIKVCISKVNPPVGGKVRQVCCMLGD